MGKKTNFVNPQTLNKKQSKTAKRYDINPQDYAFGRPGGGGVQKKDPRDFNKDIAKAAMNDYDTRRTIEAAAMAGKGKAQDFAKKGFSGIEDVTKANNMFRKMHERAGRGGDFSSNSDFAALTFGQVNRDRNKLMESIEDQKADSSKNKKNPGAQAAEEVRELSDRGKAAIEAGGDYTYQPVDRGLGMQASPFNADFNPVDRGLGNESVAYDPTAGIQDMKAGEFLNNYKADIEAGVKKAGVSARGSMSIHNKY